MIKGGGFGSLFLCCFREDRETQVDFDTIGVSQKGGELMADWLTIKTEYITTDTSYRKLAQKYGVSTKQICSVGKAENWVEERERYVNKTTAKTIEKISQQEANRAAKIHSVADKLLNKIEAMADSGRPMNSKDIRALTAAIRDLKEIQNVRSDSDRREQEARIANLQRQNKQEGGATAKLIIEGLPEEFKV